MRVWIVGIVLTLITGGPLPEAATVGNEIKTGDEGRGPLDCWTIGAGFAVVGLGSDSKIQDTLWGPSIFVSRSRPRGVGIEIGLTYTLPAGFHDFKALCGDVCASYSYPFSRCSMLQLKGGIVGIVGGDNSGGAAGDVAVYPAIGILQRLGGPLILSTDISARFWLAYGGWQSLGGKLAIHFAL